MFFNNVRSNTFVLFFTGNSNFLPKVVRRFNRTFYKSALCTGKINVQNDDKYVVLNCDDSKSLKYPIVWLRDNCQCKECFHGGSMSRIIDWSKFNVNVKIDNVSVSDFLLLLVYFVITYSVRGESYCYSKISEKVPSLNEKYSTELYQKFNSL